MTLHSITNCFFPKKNKLMNKMVDESLVNELKELREKGPSAPSDALKLFEFIKQL